MTSKASIVLTDRRTRENRVAVLFPFSPGWILRYSSLEFRLSATMTLLLLGAMLLTNLVVTLLYQQQLVRERIDAILLTLSALAAADPSGGAETGNLPRLAAGLRVLIDSGEASRGLVLPADGEPLFIPEGREGTADLRRAAMTALREGKPHLASSGLTWSTFFLQRERALVALPLTTVAGPAAIGLDCPLTPLWRTMRERQAVVLVYVLVNLILLATVGFFRFRGLVFRPLRRLEEQAASWDGAEPPLLLMHREAGELRRVGSALTTMLKRIDQDRDTLRKTVDSLELANERLRKTRQEMVRTEKLASVGRLAAGLAHEIGNPLGVVIGYLELLRAEPLSAEENELFIQRSTDELDRINRLVRQLLDFSRNSGEKRETIHVHALISDLLQFFQIQKKTRTLRFSSRLDAAVDTVHGDGEGLRQVLVNCLLNSVDAIHEAEIDDGEILVRTSSSTTHPPILLINITDNGIGIPESQRENVFDPFFTTKEPGRGTGLGLSVAHTIIENMGGKISAGKRADRGAEITITLPLGSADDQKHEAVADKEEEPTP